MPDLLLLCSPRDLDLLDEVTLFTLSGVLLLLLDLPFLLWRSLSALSREIDLFLVLLSATGNLFELLSFFSVLPGLSLLMGILLAFPEFVTEEEAESAGNL